ncbi:hypothetical protein [Paraburkholderia megapolitana]|uniref:hypothetical protein n=1 Tax=Paraburkholderia megapolitana TaxID=420953 RepID=UPI0038BACA55
MTVTADSLAPAQTGQCVQAIRFNEDLLGLDNIRLIAIASDNPSIHHGIGRAIRQRWLTNHKALLFYLSGASSELIVIGIIAHYLKRQWRRVVT